jgi:hypothetical protein
MSVVIPFPGPDARRPGATRSVAAIDDADVASTATYPYLIVRIFTAIYQRERIRIRVGSPAVEFVNRRCFVQHPVPFAVDGTLNSACRELLILGVQAAVRRLGFRMCIVWAESSCTYVETDRINESAEPLSGGSVPVELKFKPQHYEPIEPRGDDAPDSGNS